MVWLSASNLVLQYNLNIFRNISSTTSTPPQAEWLCPSASAVGLVILGLVVVRPSTYFRPNTLLQWIPIMPRLETLTIYFNFSIPNCDLERQLMHLPIVAPVTLLNLRHFVFHGVSTYLNALAHQIATPRLEKLPIDFISQLRYSIPRLLRFMNITENLMCDSAQFGSSWGEFMWWSIPMGGPRCKAPFEVWCTPLLCFDFRC